jgi:hypothetical protein
MPQVGGPPPSKPAAAKKNKKYRKETPRERLLRQARKP